MQRTTVCGGATGSAALASRGRGRIESCTKAGSSPASPSRGVPGFHEPAPRVAEAARGQDRTPERLVSWICMGHRQACKRSGPLAQIRLFRHPFPGSSAVKPHPQLLPDILAHHRMARAGMRPAWSLLPPWPSEQRPFRAPAAAECGGRAHTPTPRPSHHRSNRDNEKLRYVTIKSVLRSAHVTGADQATRQRKNPRQPLALPGEGFQRRSRAEAAQPDAARGMPSPAAPRWLCHHLHRAVGMGPRSPQSGQGTRSATSLPLPRRQTRATCRHGPPPRISSALPPRPCATRRCPFGHRSKVPRAS